MFVSIAIGIIDFYKKNISKFLPVSCRFYPTCSDYARQAILKYGIFKGSFIFIKRLIRCRPFGPSGYDPVP